LLREESPGTGKAGSGRDSHPCSLGDVHRGWFRSHAGSICSLKALCTMGAIVIGKTEKKTYNK